MKKVEICCGSYYDAVAAQNGGASRIELNSALHLGGLTPSIGTLLQVKNHTDLEVICMVRPRAAGFCYNEEDVKTMFLDAEVLLDNGADGIAFGFLDEECDIDIPHTRRMVELIHSYGKTAVFHRAIDCVVDIDRAMDILIALGVDRVLTSGLQLTAIEGAEMIKYLQEAYGEHIEILAGSGINSRNVEKFMKVSHVNQVHSSCKDWKLDPTTCALKGAFAYHGDEYECVDVEKVEEFVEIVEDDIVMI